MTDSLH